MTESTITDRITGQVPKIDPTEAATQIDADAVMLVTGFGSVGYPKAVPLALAESTRDLSLTVISGGNVGEEIDQALFEADAVARRHPYQSKEISRTQVNSEAVAFHDRHVSKLSDEVEYGHYGDPDVAVVEAVAVGEDWLIPSTSIGSTPGFVRAADKLIVEVNRTAPLALQQLHDVYLRDLPPDRDPIPLGTPGDRIGSSKIDFNSEKLVGVVETARRGDPYEFRDPTNTDLQVAANLATFLREEMQSHPVLQDQVVLQFGVGSLGNALMSQLSQIEFGDRDVIYFGEVIQDGLLDMLDAGLLETASATSLALSEDGMDRLYADVDRYAEDVVLRNADISNNGALIEQFGVVGVNSALEVDLYGHVNSTHIKGSHLVNGLGGSGDFGRNSAVSITALGSTAKDGAISRIVPLTAHTDHTEHDLSVVVTEHGVADLRGCDPRERATRLIENCAHPDFRADLREYVDRAHANGGHVPHDLDTAFTWQTQ